MNGGPAVPGDGPAAYPLTIIVGNAAITLRLMNQADREAILAFARSLPAHDLLFLRRDITQEPAVDEWLHEIASGRTVSILAVAEGGVAGYASVYRSELPWSAHVAELRVTVGPALRGKGLGRRLTGEAFACALTMGIEKMVAQMTFDQTNAIAVFEGLGFRPEAILRDHVKDAEGKKHDLLILSHEVRQFAPERQTTGVMRAFGR